LAEKLDSALANFFSPAEFVNLVELYEISSSLKRGILFGRDRITATRLLDRKISHLFGTLYGGLIGKIQKSGQTAA
jgi:hypothetical protein